MTWDHFVVFDSAKEAGVLRGLLYLWFPGIRVQVVRGLTEEMESEFFIEVTQ